jgi:hypothetical protein
MPKSDPPGSERSQMPSSNGVLHDMETAGMGARPELLTRHCGTGT